MPDVNTHLRVARNNEDFSRDLISENRYLDWAVTGIFYSAIHYVEAYLATQAIHSASHRGRDTEIYSDTNLRHIYDEISDLKNDSTQTRYQGYVFSQSEILSRIRPCLERVKSHIQSLLP